MSKKPFLVISNLGTILLNSQIIKPFQQNDNYTHYYIRTSLGIEFQLNSRIHGSKGRS